jgi:hypothetical protein
VCKLTSSGLELLLLKAVFSAVQPLARAVHIPGAEAKVRKVIFQLCLILLVASFAAAGTINLDSAAGLTTVCRGGAVFSCGTSVTVTPHPAWQSNNPVNPGDPSDTSAVWISYADTGYSGSQFQPYQGTTPVVSIFDNFTSGAGLFTLNVWSDDTADVILDGNYLMHAVFTQSTCSGQPIGCRPQDAGVFSQSIGAGSHTLEFVMYQVGTGTGTVSNPFGLLFTGTAPSATPEPSSMLLLGTGLIGVAGSIRRKLKR